MCIRRTAPGRAGTVDGVPLAGAPVRLRWWGVAGQSHAFRYGRPRGAAETRRQGDTGGKGGDRLQQVAPWKGPAPTAAECRVWGMPR